MAAWKARCAQQRSPRRAARGFAVAEQLSYGATEMASALRRRAVLAMPTGYSQRLAIGEDIDSAAFRQTPQTLLGDAP
ncbi:hypothetical protein ACIQ7D_06060 [Streptomyces sp. NPDC096310]|uniref:hypothetical protein n=1 Tax=Streptomyces sp. NPDC096310 TaxID=3366082 RepID=UPI00382C7B67